MKKCLILLPLILCIACINAPKAVVAEEHPIDTVLTKCMENNHTTAGMNECTISAIEAWEKEINNYVKLIKDELNEEQIAIFEKSQNRWQDFYQSERKTVFETVFVLNGTIHTTIGYGLIADIVKNRALYLKSFLADLTFDKDILSE